MALTSEHCQSDVVYSSAFQASPPLKISQLSWDDKEQSLRELITSYRLPLVVKLVAGDINCFVFDKLSGNGISNESTVSGNSSPPVCDTDATSGCDQKPLFPGSAVESKSVSACCQGECGVVLQVHETRRRKIILAHKMTWGKRQHDCSLSEEQVELPASFKGWFEVVPEDGRPVEYFDTIGGIASIHPRRFLVRTSIVSYQLSTEENGSSSWAPYEIKPGDVLTTGIIYTDTKKTKNSTNRNILRRLLKQSKSKKEQDLKYLQCFDSNDMEVMIPFIMSGIFSPVGDSTEANFDAVYELQDLIMAFGFPVNTQLIFASTKDGFHCPRGMLRLYGTREEELAVVSKVGPNGVVLAGSVNCDKFEIPLDRMLFSRGIMKKTPVIKSHKGCSYPDGKIVPKYKSEDCEIKNQDYVTTKLMDGFRTPVTADERCSTTHSNTSKRTYGRFTHKTATTCEDTGSTNCHSGSCEKIDVDNNVKLSSQCTIVSDLNTQPASVDDTLEQTDSHQFQDLKLNSTKDVKLPERVRKELKKSRSTSILDKLSVRKIKQERARLKELQKDDVFSRRITRCELSYQEFSNGLDHDETKSTSNDAPKPNQNDSGSDYNSGVYHMSNMASVACSTSTPNTLSKTSSKGASDTAMFIQRKANIQKRGLPPIPVEAQANTEQVASNHISTESLYEHLPPAPELPQCRRASDSALLDDKCHPRSIDAEENPEDDYMMPLQVQQRLKCSESSHANVFVKQCGLTADSKRSARTGRTISELPRQFVSRRYDNDEGHSLESDDLFNRTYTCSKYGEKHPLYSRVEPPAFSTPQLYMASRRRDFATNQGHFNQRFGENSEPDAINCSGELFLSGGLNSGFQKHINTNRKTARSRSLRSTDPIENSILNQTDSIPGSKERHSVSIMYNLPNNYLQQSQCQHAHTHASWQPLLSSHSVDASLMSEHLQQYQLFYGRDYNINYATTDPVFCSNTRSTSLSGASDMCVKQGDDSAISLCSRGEAGNQNESEYSYKSQVGPTEDVWMPPERLEALSVQEVAKSLRYIGMKDRIILRFSNEQIDGSMLCSLDKKLLNEGFPELNALEVKKILDFVHGWRPKKN